MFNNNLFGGNGLNTPPLFTPTNSGFPNQDPTEGLHNDAANSITPPPSQAQTPGTPPTPPSNPFNLQPIQIGLGGPAQGNTPPPTPGQTTQSLPSTLGLSPQQGARVTVGGQTYVGDGTNWTVTNTPAPNTNTPINTTTPAPNPFAGTNPFIPNVTSPTVNVDGSPGATYNFSTPGNPNLNYATQDAAQRVAQLFGLPMGEAYRGALPGGQASDPLFTVRLPNGDSMPAGQIISWLNRGDSEADIRARLGLSGGSPQLGGYGAPGTPTFGPLNRQSFQAPSPVPASQLSPVPETFLIPNSAIPQIQDRALPQQPSGNSFFPQNQTTPPQAGQLDPITSLLLALFLGQQPSQGRARQPRLPAYGRTNLYPGI